jgi:Chloroplast import apparatus Tic20-like
MAVVLRGEIFMNWHNRNVSPSDRLFACLPYTLPIIDVVQYGGSLFSTFPILSTIYSWLTPIFVIYKAVPLGSFGIFLILYIAVVRNPRVPRFIRFNVLQSLMLGVLVSLFGLTLEYLFKTLLTANNPIVVLLPMLAFLSVWVVCLFSMIKSAMGEYAEVPKLSENVHLILDSST